jgi:hypothetical protein
MTKKIIYVVLNHNNNLLGEFDTKAEAEEEAHYYRHQTGNVAYVDQVEITVKEIAHA